MFFSNIIVNLLSDSVKIGVYKTLSRHPEGMTGRGLAALISTSPFKINQVLRELVSQGVIEESVIGRAHQYRLNKQHILIRDLILPLIDFEEKILTNLGAEIMKRLEKNPPLSVILFGSVARGDAEPLSDIDVFLIYTDKDETPGPISETGDLLSEWITRSYGNHVSLRRAWVSDFQRRARERDPLIRNVIEEGKCLAGLSLTELLDYGKTH